MKFEPPTQIQDTDLIRRAPECRTEPPAGYEWKAPPFRFALAFCERDADRCLDLLIWMMELGPVDRELVLFYDKGTPDSVLDPILREAKFVFSCVTPVKLAKSGAGWPGSNNFVWYHICNQMRKGDSPWLLLETDLAPCRTDWVSTLEAEYRRARKPFMGAWVEYYDIMNGAGVYPADVTAWVPEFFKGNPLMARAYDCAIAPQIMWFTHNATHLMPHIWYTRSNGRPGGLIPQVPVWTERMCEWICDHNAVLVHRCKDATLINYLREKRKKNLEQIGKRTYP